MFCQILATLYVVKRSNFVYRNFTKFNQVYSELTFAITKNIYLIYTFDSVRVHPCPCLCWVSMSMLCVLFDAACLCPCYRTAYSCPGSMSVFRLHVHVHAACPLLVRNDHCRCWMSVSGRGVLHVHVHAACPCPCCMSMSMMHVHVHSECLYQ